ncbi:hypothetical protein FSP39_017523 [Pinctada imbricata]|uniref:CARD domain-containing protein n=1 Tax=Pinctada imbricata TaxID=66713 RepID=A0AA88YAX0_PINIB|nr:hypothetical protein FSP39_017523 [Pinctada imbricata]
MAEVKFLADHGENVIVSPDGETVNWNFVYMGGVAFSRDPLEMDRIVGLTLSESGHVQLGLTYKNPAHITNVRAVLHHDVKIVNDIRVHRKVCDIKVQLIRKSDSGFEVTFTDTKGDKIQCTSVDPNKHVWLVVHLEFGSILASTGKMYSDTAFDQVKGENIQLSNDNKEIGLRDPHAGTACCLSRRLTPGTAVRLSIRPIKTGDKPPRKYHVTIGYANKDPENFKTEFSDYLRVANTGTPLKPWHTLATLRKSGEISIQFIDNNEIRIDENLYPLRRHPGTDHAICLVFEVFRAGITVLGVEEVDLSQFRDLDPYQEISHRVDSRVQAVESSLQGGSQLVNFPEVEELEDLKLDIENAYLDPLPTKPISSGYCKILSSETLYDRNQQRDSVDRIYDKIQHISQSMEELKKQGQRPGSDLAVQKVEEIRELLEKLLDPRSPVPSINDESPLDKTNLEKIRSQLRKNYQKIISDLDLISLIDILFQKEVLSFTEYEDLRDKHKNHRKDANRDFVGICLKRPFNVAEFVQAFEDTNQGFLLSMHQ